jgi:hypothetical protein
VTSSAIATPAARPLGLARHMLGGFLGGCALGGALLVVGLLWADDAEVAERGLAASNWRYQATLLLVTGIGLVIDALVLERMLRLRLDRALLVGGVHLAGYAATTAVVFDLPGLASWSRFVYAPAALLPGVLVWLLRGRPPEPLLRGRVRTVRRSNPPA